MKLLLIDSRIVEKQIFIDSCTDDTSHIIFDYMNDTYDSILGRDKIAQEKYTDIALVQHTDMLIGIKMLEQEPRCDSYDSAPYTSFDKLMSFLRTLKERNGLQRFDFLGCAIYDAHIMPTIFSALEADLGIDLRASTNFTGNAPDGDWIMESDNVDVRDKYFTEAIQEWKGTLGVTYFKSYGNKTGISGDIVASTLDAVSMVTNDYLQDTRVFGDAGVNMPGGIPINLKGIKVRNIAFSGRNSAIIDTSGRLWVWDAIALRDFEGVDVRMTSNPTAYIPSGLSGVTFASLHMNAAGGFAAISETDRRLYTWGGSTGYGGGWGDTIGGIPSTLANVRVKRIISNQRSYIFIVISETDQVYFLGSDAGKNGLIPTNLSGVKIQDAALAIHAATVIDMSGRVYVFGSSGAGGSSSSFVTALTPAGLENIQATACVGTETAFAIIDSNKRVWSWGSSADGGAGASANIAATPSGLMDIPVSNIYGFERGFSVNGFAAIAENTGQLYVWGRSGMGGSNNATVSTPVSLVGVPIKYVVNNHFVCVDMNDRVRMWRSNIDASVTGQIVGNLSNVVVSSIATSVGMGYAVIDVNKNVHVFGETGQSILYGTNVNTAVTLSGLSNIKEIVGAENGFIALSEENKVYIFGDNNGSRGRTTTSLFYTVADKEIDSIHSLGGVISSTNYAMIDKITGEVYSGLVNAKSRPVSILPGKKVIKIVATNLAFTYLTDEPLGNVYTFGAISAFVTYGTVPIVPPNLENRKIKNIYSIQDTFAAIDMSGRVFTWGNDGANTNHSNNSTYLTTYKIAATPNGLLNIPIIDIYTKNNEFLGISDISKNLYRFSGNNVSIPSGLENVRVKEVYISSASYGILDENNKIYTLGDINNGGAGTNTSTAGIPVGLENLQILNVATTEVAYAVIDENKRLWCWGGYGGGGVNSTNTRQATTPAGLENITFSAIYGGARAFVAISEIDKRVYAWGSNNRGGAGADNFTAATPSGLTNIPVSNVIFNNMAVAVITDISNYVYAWGSINDGSAGGNSTITAGIPSGLQNISVKGIVGNEYSFTALTSDNKVYAWGHVGSGGAGINNQAAGIPVGMENVTISGVISNRLNYNAFGSDGTIYTWGFQSYTTRLASVDYNITVFNNRKSARDAGIDTTLTGRGINLIEGSTPLLVPSAPRNATVVVGNTEATVSFTASQYTGNSPILHYEVNVNNGEIIVTTETVAQITLSGLTNGITYTATVKAVNAIGSSASSTLTFIPGTALPPTTVTSVSTDGQLTVSFSASPNNNGSVVTHYIVSVSGQDISGLTSPITFTGLTNGTSYNITVRAVNEVGIGAASVPITGMPGTVPGAPSITQVTPNGNTATITVSPGTTGTTRTEYYLVESVPSGITISGASRNIVVSGLTAGTNYQFTAKAVNSIGESIASAQSNVITVFNLQVGNGRYVRFSRSSGYPDYININQIDIFDASNNKHTPVTATQSTTLGGYPASNVIDSDINSFSHTNVSSDSEWVEVDLGTDKEIKKVVIYHRSGVFSRALNLYFTVKDSINNITYTSSPITTSAASHTFDNITGTRNTNMGVPQITNMTYANDELTIAFNPVNDALSYTIAVNTISKTATEGPITISGFTNGTTYNLIVSATGANGINFTTTTFIAGNALIAPLIAPTISGVSIAKDTATISFNTLNLNPSVSKYVISSLSGDITYETTSSPVIISGLIAGTNYQFTVKAVNLIGEGPISAPSDIVTATNEVLTRYVRFSRVTNVNYIMLSEIEVYDQHNVKIIPASASQSSTYPGYPASNVLDNNTSTFHHTQNSPNEFIEVDLGTPRVVSKVISYNRQGSESNSLQLVMTTRDTNNNVLYTAPAISTTAPSHTFNITSASEVVTPSAPTGLTALPGSGQLTINFTAPPDVSGFPTASYRITVTPGNITRTIITTSITISGLTNGTAHTVTVAAINANGTGAAATISGIRPSTVPNAPTLLSVSGGDGIARISFSAPLNDGGSTITNFMAISTPDNRIGYGLVSPITISGLTDSIPYTFKVAAINAAGTSAYSTASSSITLQTSIPTSATQAISLSAPTSVTTSNTTYIEAFVQASTKTPAEIFVELRAAKKAAISTRTTAQVTELVKSISKSVSAKAVSQVIDVPFVDIVPTLTSSYSGIESKPVAAILPDFSTDTPPVIDLSTLIAQDKHILIEAPENLSFRLSDGVVTKSFTLSTLSGEKYIYETDDVTQKYFIGSVLTFGTFSKRILGFGSIIFGTANVTVTIPITFTLSGVDVKILGQLFTMAGIKINVNNTLSVSGFYDQSGYSWIQYKQGNNEDDFIAGIKDVSGAIAVKNTILSSLNVSGGSVYVPARQGTTNMDCSAVFVGHAARWTNFHNLQDFIISYFANKVLGHPGALAAISNDSQIRTNVTNGFPLALDELKVMQEDKLKSIVQQMMNQDLARFSQDEKDVFNPLKFRAGDKVIMRIILADNTYSLKNPAGNPSSVVGGVTTAQSASATSTKVNIGSNDDYLLVFTLA